MAGILADACSRAQGKLRCNAPPEAVVLGALPELIVIPGMYEERRGQLKIEWQKLVDSVDSPRFFPMLGAAQLHRCHWKCSASYTKAVKLSVPSSFFLILVQLQVPCRHVIYIDADQLYPVIIARS